jgi:hypothetical protein
MQCLLLLSLWDPEINSLLSGENQNVPLNPLNYSKNGVFVVFLKGKPLDFSLFEFLI